MTWIRVSRHIANELHLEQLTGTSCCHREFESAVTIIISEAETATKQWGADFVRCEAPREILLINIHEVCVFRYFGL